MSTERKPMANSKEEAVKTMIAAATRHIQPPRYMDMSERDMELFNEIIDEFAKVKWTPHMLTVAAMLAKVMNDWITDQSDLRQEGSVIDTERGPKMNPLRQAVAGYATQILSFRRSLSLNATADTRGVDVARDNAIKKSQEEGNPLDHNHDDLLAIPSGAASRDTVIQ